MKKRTSEWDSNKFTKKRLNYLVSKKEINQFNSQGYLVLKNVLTEKQKTHEDSPMSACPNMNNPDRNITTQQLLPVCRKMI